MATRGILEPPSAPALFQDFFQPWDQWFDDSSLVNRVKNVPAVNIIENENNYMISVAAPGLKKEDLKIDVEGNMLTISSEKEESKEEKKEKFTRREYSFTSFSRSFALPEDVKQEDIDARYENGELNIMLPRKENLKKATLSKQISVK